MNYAEWDESRDEFLKKHYNKDLNLKDISTYLKCSKSSVCRRALKLGLTTTRGKLTESDIQYILSNIKEESINSLAKKFLVDTKTVRSVLYQNGMKNPRSQRSVAVKWTKEEEEFLTTNYHNFSLSALAEFLTRTVKSVEKKATLLKLGKKGRPNSCVSGNEVKTANILFEMGFDYERELDVGNHFSCDFFIKEYNLIIEVQGSYWHSESLESALTEKQKETYEKDQRKKDHILSLGYNLLYIRDTQLKNIQECKKYILEYLPPNLVNCGK